MESPFVAALLLTLALPLACSEPIPVTVRFVEGVEPDPFEDVAYLDIEVIQADGAERLLLALDEPLQVQLPMGDETTVQVRGLASDETSVVASGTLTHAQLDQGRAEGSVELLFLRAGAISLLPVELDEPRAYHGAGSLGDGTAGFAGGLARREGSTALASVEVFDPTSGSSPSGDLDLTYARAEMGTVAAPEQGILWFLGGRNRTNILASVEELILDGSGAPYVREAGEFVLQTPRYGMTATRIGEQAVLVGGTSCEGPCDVVEIMDLDGTLAHAGTLASARTHHTAADVYAMRIQPPHDINRKPLPGMRR